jgi:predicted transcriptional regulator
MSQSWKTDLLAEINEYFRTYEANSAKNALKRGYLAPDGGGKYKLTSSGEKFINDVRSYLRRQKNRV